MPIENVNPGGNAPGSQNVTEDQAPENSNGLSVSTEETESRAGSSAMATNTTSRGLTRDIRHTGDNHSPRASVASSADISQEGGYKRMVNSSRLGGSEEGASSPGKKAKIRGRSHSASEATTHSRNSNVEEGARSRSSSAPARMESMSTGEKIGLAFKAVREYFSRKMGSLKSKKSKPFDEIDGGRSSKKLSSSQVKNRFGKLLKNLKQTFKREFSSPFVRIPDALENVDEASSDPNLVDEGGYMRMSGNLSSSKAEAKSDKTSSESRRSSAAENIYVTPEELIEGGTRPEMPIYATVNKARRQVENEIDLLAQTNTPDEIETGFNAAMAEESIFSDFPSSRGNTGVDNGEENPFLFDVFIPPVDSGDPDFASAFPPMRQPNLSEVAGQADAEKREWMESFGSNFATTTKRDTGKLASNEFGDLLDAVRSSFPQPRLGESFRTAPPPPSPAMRDMGASSENFFPTNFQTAGDNTTTTSPATPRRARSVSSPQASVGTTTPPPVPPRARSASSPQASNRTPPPLPPRPGGGAANVRSARGTPPPIPPTRRKI